MTPDLVREIVKRTRHIEGWFSPEAAYLFSLLDHAQQQGGVQGNLFEIGVHHGKSAILLGAMADPAREILGVCDLFGSQGGNRSASGAGDRDIFMENFRASFPDHGFLRVFEKPSGDLTPEEVTQSCRFFHIDGGHTAEEALGDLELAAEALSEQGVIVIDDAFSPVWPSVTEAIFRFFTSRPGCFVPLVIGFNKLAIIRPSATELYRSCLEAPDVYGRFVPCGPYEATSIELLGHAVRIFSLPSWVDVRSIKSRLALFAFANPWMRNRATAGLVSLARRLLRRNE